jgi:competence protein ComEC
MQLFRVNPFLRLLIPYLLGILYALNNLTLPVSILLTVTILTGALALGVYVLRMKKEQVYSRLVFLFLLDVFLFLSACCSCELRNPSNDPHFLGHHYSEKPVTCVAEIVNIPEEVKFKQKLLLEVYELRKDSLKIPVKARVLAYLPINHKSMRLNPGEHLVFKARLFPIETTKNPETFDYKQYANDLNIYYRCYPDSQSFQVIPAENQFGLKRLGLVIQQKVIHFIKGAPLTQSAKGICNALITGYDADVEKPIMDGFAATGTLHILSVSGMHVGIIYWALQFLLSFFGQSPRARIWQFLVISLLLWGFALICGFEAPILRAVIMFTLFGFGECVYPYRGKQQINIVLCSAFLLLLFNPVLIRNGGFLLSYFAVIGLITIHPWLFQKCSFENKLLNAIWLNISISVSATIATLPLSLYYFHFFPLWFIPCNLIVVPLSYGIMASVLLLFVSKSLGAMVINGLTSFLLGFNSWFAGAGNRVHITFSGLDAIAVYLILLSIGFAIYHKRFVAWAFCLYLIGGWQFLHLIEDYQKSRTRQFTIYHHYKHTGYSYSKGLVYANDSVLIQRVIKPHLQMRTDRWQQARFNVFIHDSIRFAEARQADNFTEIKKLHPTHVLINTNYPPDSAFFENSALKYIIVGAAANFKTRQQVKRLCYNFGVDCWDMNTKGFYQHIWKE